jgi:hypothetical protein
MCNLQVIAAEGEQKASRALKEASDIISESPAALQLRYRMLSVFTLCRDRKTFTHRVLPPPLPLIAEKAGRNHWNNLNTPLLITAIGERYSQTMSI